MATGSARVDSDPDQLLLALQTRFSWPKGTARIRLLQEWEHGEHRSSFHRYRELEPGTLDVLLKVDRRWPAQAPRHLYAELLGLAQILKEAGVTGFRVPDPLGWNDDPPALCVVYVEGSDLQAVLSDPRHELWKDPKWDPRAAIANCGKALGTFHGAYMVPTVVAWRSVRTEAIAAQRRKARKLLVLNTRFLQYPEESFPLTRRIGNFVVENLRVAASGEIYLTDAPFLIQFRSIYNDISRFAWSVQQALDTQREGGPDPRPPMRDLCEEFYEGYSVTGPDDVRKPLNRRMLDVEDISVRVASARKLCKAGRYRTALHDIRSAGSIRTSMGRSRR